MTHLHKATGLKFEIGTLTEQDTGRMYDMTVIMLWGDSGRSCVSPIIIDYYFGDYNELTTDEYINKWLEENAAKLISSCLEIVHSYYITNEDVLQEAEFKTLRNKVEKTRQLLHCLDAALND